LLLPWDCLRRIRERIAASKRRAITLTLVFLPSWTATLVVAGFIVTLDDHRADALAHDAGDTQPAFRDPKMVDPFSAGVVAATPSATSADPLLSASTILSWRTEARSGIHTGRVDERNRT
jgi:hypothetical protein